jgi:hypothetical protein
MSTFIDLIDVTSTANGLTLTQSRTYGAGERALVWVRYVSGSVTPSVSDGTNTYTQLGTTLVDVATGSSYALFECKNTAAGTVTVTFTLTSPGAAFRTMTIARYSGADTSVAGIAAKQGQSAPGTGATAVSSGNLTPGSQPGTLVGFGYDDSGSSTLNAGTGFTSRGTMANQDAAFGTASRVEDIAITSTSAVAATFGSPSGGGTDNFTAFAVFFPDAAGAVTQLEDPNRRTSAQVAAMRQPVSMPQSIKAGLALFLTGAQGPTVPVGGDVATLAQEQALAAHRGPANIVAQPEPPSVTNTALAVTIGPTVPMGSRSVGQALAAYRETSRLPQAPRPVITQGGAAPAAFMAPTTVPLPQAQTWPYASIQAAEATASQFGIPDADLIFDRLKPDIVPAQPWVHGQVAAAAAAPEIAAVIPVATAVPPSAVSLPSSRDWPYHEFTLPDVASSASVLFGTTPIYLGGPPVRLPPPQPWPYASAVAIEFGPAAITFVAPLPPTFSPVVLPMPQPPWPHALQQPRATQFLGITPIYSAPPPVVAYPVQPWPYAALVQPQAPNPPPAPVQPPAVVVVTMQPPAAWPHSSAMMPVKTAAFFGAGAVYLKGPPVLLPAPPKPWWIPQVFSPGVVAPLAPVVVDVFTDDSRARVGSKAVRVKKFGIGPFRQ